MVCFGGYFNMDYPDFRKPVSIAQQEIGVEDRRDWASKKAETKSWAFESVADVEPGDYSTYNIYTIPAKKVFYCADFGMGLEFRGWGVYKIADGSYIWATQMEAWDSKIVSLSTPAILVADEILQAWCKNFDIISGKFSGYFWGWETAASKPKKPKSDDPEERYMLGDFNRAYLRLLPKGETEIWFSKIGEAKRNYLKFRDFGGPKQKKLASKIIRPA